MLSDTARSGAALPPSEPRTSETSLFASPAGRRQSARSGQTWDWADWLGIFAGFLLTLAVTTVNQRGRIFWEDEVLGWLLLRDTSWLHMLRAWNLGADGGGFSFYLLGRGWFALFGDSALSFRLFSSTCFGLAFVATWAALRRAFPSWIVAFATFNALFFSPPLTMHFLEGRFYGLLVLSTALAMWLVLRLDAAGESLPLRLYLAAFAIHALLTTSHALGVLFSAFLLGAVVVLDRLAQRWRPRLYLTVAAAWVFLVPERTSIAAAARVGKPHFWTRPPTLRYVFSAYTGFSHEIFIVLALLLLGAALTLSSGQGLRGNVRGAFIRYRSVVIAASALLLVPVALLLEGLVGTWLFTDRYLQPIIVGVAFVTALLLAITSENPVLRSWARCFPVLVRGALSVGALGYVAMLLFWVFHHTAQNTPEVLDFTDQLTARLPASLPVVVDDAFTFTELVWRQSNAPVRYLYLLDWPYAISADAPRLEVTQYHLMENWKRAGYYPGHVEYLNSFLEQHPQFLVVHETPIVPVDKPEIGNPIAQRLAATGGYEVRVFFTLDRRFSYGVRDTVYLVCRGRCGETVPLPHPDRCLQWARGVDCCDGLACHLPVPPEPRHHAWLPRFGHSR